MSGNLNKEWFWQDNFFYNEDLLNKHSEFVNYTVEIFVVLHRGKLYLFQPTAIFFPFIFTHSISNKKCRMNINKNYIYK